MANKTIYTVAAGFVLAVLCGVAVYIYGIYEYRTGYKQAEGDIASVRNEAHIKEMAEANAASKRMADKYLAKQKESEREKQKLESSLSGMRTIANSLQQQLNAASGTSVSNDTSATCERYRGEAETYRLLFSESLGEYAAMAEEADRDLVLVHEAKDWILVVP